MKKLILLCGLAMYLSGCGDRVQSSDCPIMIFNDFGVKSGICYDKETGVEYFIHSMGGYCPRYNADGTLKIHEGY